LTYISNQLNLSFSATNLYKSWDTIDTTCKASYPEPNASCFGKQCLIKQRKGSFADALSLHMCAAAHFSTPGPWHMDAEQAFGGILWMVASIGG
jgi:hypothetical protein